MPKGICKNIGKPCSLALSKEVQEADSSNFVCSECGKQLFPVSDSGSAKRAETVGSANPQHRRRAAGPAQGNNKKKILLIIVLAIVIAAIVVVAVAMLSGGDNGKPVDPRPVVDTTTVVPSDTTDVDPDTINRGGEDPVENPGPGSRTVLGGAATLSANKREIVFNRTYRLNLNTLDDETLTVHANDKIRNPQIENDYLLGGELVQGKHERYLSGLYERL